jgi:membrane-associated phospholipid phosphatase
MLRVPQITQQKQIPAMALGYLAFSIVYLGSAALARTPATLLEPGALDLAVPFVDWSVWVYLSQFLLLPVALVAARDDADRSRAYYAMLLATAMAALVFVLWPTALVRQTTTPGGFTSLAWNMLYLVDTPSNCFPSLHVALAALAGCALWRRGARVTAIVWPLSIMISTLTTRQHVVLDIAGGLLCAAAAWKLTPRIADYERPYSARYAGRA